MVVLPPEKAKAVTVPKFEKPDWRVPLVAFKVVAVMTPLFCNAVVLN